MDDLCIWIDNGRVAKVGEYPASADRLPQKHGAVKCIEVGCVNPSVTVRGAVRSICYPGLDSNALDQLDKKWADDLID